MPYYDYSRGIGKGLEAIGQAIAAVQGMKVQLAAQKAKMEYDEQQQRNEFNQRLELVDHEHKLAMERALETAKINFNAKMVDEQIDSGNMLKSGTYDPTRSYSFDDFEQSPTLKSGKIRITEEMANSIGGTAGRLAKNMVGMVVDGDQFMQAALNEDLANRTSSRMYGLESKRAENDIKLASLKGEITKDTKDNPVKKILDIMKAETAPEDAQIEEATKAKTQIINYINSIKGTNTPGVTDILKEQQAKMEQYDSAINNLNSIKEIKLIKYRQLLMNELNKIKQGDVTQQTQSGTVTSTNTNNAPTFMKTIGKTVMDDTLSTDNFYMRMLDNL
jgi:hypothetical protein